MRDNWYTREREREREVWGEADISFFTSKYPVIVCCVRNSVLLMSVITALNVEVLHTEHRDYQMVFQTCHFDLTQILNECEKKSEYTEKNLNLTTKISLLYRNLSQIQREKKSELESGHLNFTKFHEKNLNDSDKI